PEAVPHAARLATDARQAGLPPQRYLRGVADLRAALTHALGPMYRVEREVRPVGDCRLFVAREVPTGPELLVKLLPAGLSLAVDAGLFEQELQLVADRLRHPQIVAPRGAGRAGAVVYHTRAFVAGTTLRAWLMRHGELPLRRMVEILRDVLAALAHAHAASVAHGDLKPENVLLTDEGALVADTGIVDGVGRSLPGGAAAAGAALCAAPYMAPERRDGGTTGPRADMFAVGVLGRARRCPRSGHSSIARGSVPPPGQRRCLRARRGRTAPPPARIRYQASLPGVPWNRPTRWGVVQPGFQSAGAPIEAPDARARRRARTARAKRSSGPSGA